MKSLQGSFVIASPDLQDPNFRRTVVLMVRHDEQGAFGVILNRPATVRFADIWRQVSQIPTQIDRPVLMGGPVDGPLMAVHGYEDYSDIEVLPGSYFTMGSQQLESLASEADEEHIRFFVGHAGWGAGQLESELQEGSWLTTPATSEEIFSSAENLYERITQRLAQSVISELDIRHIPHDPTLN